jgi:hypothetical protein
MNQTNQNKDSIFVILFFLLLFNFLLFFQSKKIILWEEKSDQLKGNVFKNSVFFLAQFYENLKEKVGLKEFFENEHLFWLRLKTSPVIFVAQAQTKSKEKNIDLKEKEIISSKEELESSMLFEKEIQTNTQELKENSTDLITFEEKDELKIKESSVGEEMRILIIGDSMVAAGGGLGEMLEKELKKEFIGAKILREGKVSSGLSRPDYFNWEVRLKQLVFQFNPNIAILVFGLNDAQALTDPKGGIVVSYEKFAQAEWINEYRKRIRKMVEILNENGSFVFWVGLPIVRNSIFAQKLEFLNKIYEKEMENFEKAVFIPIWCTLCDNGKYTDYFYNEKGIKQLVRTSDGIHFQYFGGRIVSRVIIDQMKKILNL